MAFENRKGSICHMRKNLRGIDILGFSHAVAHSFIPSILPLSPLVIIEIHHLAVSEGTNHLDFLRVGRRQELLVLLISCTFDATFWLDLLIALRLSAEFAFGMSLPTMLEQRTR